MERMQDRTCSDEGSAMGWPKRALFQKRSSNVGNLFSDEGSAMGWQRLLRQYDLVGSSNCKKRALFQKNSSNVGSLLIDVTPKWSEGRDFSNQKAVGVLFDLDGLTGYETVKERREG